MQHSQGFRSLSLGGQWLLPLAPKEMDSDEEELEEGNAHSDCILRNVRAAISQGYRGFEQPKPVPLSADPLDQRWNQLQVLRLQREKELRRLKGTSWQLEMQADAYRQAGPLEDYRKLQSKSEDMTSMLERMRDDKETYEGMLQRITTDNEALRTKTKRLKQAFARIDSQVQTALSVIQIDENSTLSFSQQKHTIQTCIDSMREQRLTTLTDLYVLFRLKAAETARNEVSGVKASWISEQIRQIHGKDRRMKLENQIKYEQSVISQAEVMKSRAKRSFHYYKSLTDRFVQAFGTSEPQQVFRKYHEVMMRSDLLQTNVDQMLVADAKLRKEYQVLKQEWCSLLMFESIELRPVSNTKIVKTYTGKKRVDIGEVVYHWMNNLAAMVTRVSRVDVFDELGAGIAFPMQITKPEDDSAAISQAARLCLVLEKKLVAAIEVTQQRTQAKFRRRKQPSNILSQSSGEEKLRTRLISEQHFIRNPPADIQTLIGSYVSTIQKEVNLKQMSVKLPRQPTKVKEEDFAITDKSETEFWESSQAAAKTCRVSLPVLEPLTAVQRIVKEPLTERQHESELRKYVATRTRELRKSASTEGLVDFMKDLRIRKRNLARFIDKHKTHIRGLSQATESALEGTHKRTVSSLASTCPSAGRDLSTYFRPLDPKKTM